MFSKLSIPFRFLGQNSARHSLIFHVYIVSHAVPISFHLDLMTVITDEYYCQYTLRPIVHANL
jgi:hypothetical protein